MSKRILAVMICLVVVATVFAVAAPSNASATGDESANAPEDEGFSDRLSTALEFLPRPIGVGYKAV